MARLRFQIIGPLLAAPPEPGTLQAALAQLAAQTWRHPASGLDVELGVSTLERAYCAARRAHDPVAALKDSPRGDVGRFPSLTPPGYRDADGPVSRASGLDGPAPFRQSPRNTERARHRDRLLPHDPALYLATLFLTYFEGLKIECQEGLQCREMGCLGLRQASLYRGGKGIERGVVLPV